MAIVRYRPWGVNNELQSEIRSVFDRSHRIEIGICRIENLPLLEDLVQANGYRDRRVTLLVLDQPGCNVVIAAGAPQRDPPGIGPEILS